MFISNFYGFLLDEFGMLSRRAGFSATAELSCCSYLRKKCIDLHQIKTSSTKVWIFHMPFVYSKSERFIKFIF